MEKEIIKVKGETLSNDLYHPGNSAVYHNETYKFVTQRRTSGDGEWFQVIVQRESDGKFFEYEWGYGDTKNFYEDNLYEVKQITSFDYE